MDILNKHLTKDLDIKLINSKLLMIFLLAQLIDEEILDVEKELQKAGKCRMEMKREVKKAITAIRELKNNFHKQLNSEQIDWFIEDLEALKDKVYTELNKWRNEAS